MTAMRDPDRLIRAFLDEGVAELPDRSYDAVRAHLDRTRQRAVTRPWRTTSMPRIVGIPLTAAAVLVVVVVLAQLLPGSSVGPGISPRPSPEQTQTASPTPVSPTPGSTGLGYTWPGRLASGTYTTSLIWDTPFAFTFRVPGGDWEARDVEIIRDPVSRVNEIGGSRGTSLEFSRVESIFADPCAGTLGDPLAALSVDSTAAGLAALPGARATTPVPTNVGGYAGRYLELVLDDIPCPPAEYRMWTVNPNWHRPSAHVGSDVFVAERARFRIWVLDVNGWVLLVAAMAAADATDQDLAQLQSAIDSIRIGPPVEPSSRGACSLTLTNPADGAVVEAPYLLREVSRTFPLHGAIPVDQAGNPLTPAPPLAQLDFAGEGWRFSGNSRPRVDVVAPAGSVKRGFTTSTGVGGFQGSLVFDDVGRWWFRIADGSEQCVRLLPVDVAPKP